jgi:aspartate/methionine/tyrosine aminotransferase
VTGFVPPPYPYDRLNRLTPITEAHAGGTVDLSIGTPFDPPPAHVVEALSSSGTERSYPPSIGTLPFREAAGRWMRRRFDVEVPTGQIGGDDRFEGVRRHPAPVDALAHAIA